MAKTIWLLNMAPCPVDIKTMFFPPAQVAAFPL